MPRRQVLTLTLWWYGLWFVVNRLLSFVVIVVNISNNKIWIYGFNLQCDSQHQANEVAGAGIVFAEIFIFNYKVL